MDDAGIDIDFSASGHESPCSGTSGVNAFQEFTPEKVEPFWVGFLRLTDHTVSAKRGMHAKFLLQITDDHLHPFRGQRVGPASGQRFRLQASTSPRVGDPQPIYEGDVILSWWQQDSYGCHISLKLDDGPDGNVANPFQSVVADRECGDILAAAFYRVDDDEVERGRRRKRFTEMGPAQQSQILCRSDATFQNWVIGIGREFGVAPTVGETKADTAARAVRMYCGVESRSEFADPNRGDAVRAWQDLYTMFRNGSV